MHLQRTSPPKTKAKTLYKEKTFLNTLKDFCHFSNIKKKTTSKKRFSTTASKYMPNKTERKFEDFLESQLRSVKRSS